MGLDDIYREQKVCEEINKAHIERERNYNTGQCPICKQITNISRETGKCPKCKKKGEENLC